MKKLDRLFKDKYDVSVSETPSTQSVRYTVEVSCKNFRARHSLIHEDREKAVELCLLMISDKIKKQRTSLLRYYPDVFSESLIREKGISSRVPYDVNTVKIEELKTDEALMKLELDMMPYIIFKNSSSGELTVISYNEDGRLQVATLV